MDEEEIIRKRREERQKILQKYNNSGMEEPNININSSVASPIIDTSVVNSRASTPNSVEIADNATAAVAADINEALERSAVNIFDDNQDNLMNDTEVSGGDMFAEGDMFTDSYLVNISYGDTILEWNYL